MHEKVLECGMKRVCVKIADSYEELKVFVNRFKSGESKGAKYLVVREHICEPSEDRIEVTLEEMTEYNTHAAAYAGVVADCGAENICWTRPNWTAVSKPQQLTWVISVINADGVLIPGSMMGPARFEFEQQ